MTATHRTYRVSYWIEQGYAVTVRARSAEHAEQLVAERLDCETDPLPDSERLHHDHGVCSAELLEIGGRS